MYIHVYYLALSNIMIYSVLDMLTLCFLSPGHGNMERERESFDGSIWEYDVCLDYCLMFEKDNRIRMH